MSRSLKKGPYVDPNVYEKVQRQIEAGTNQPLKTRARRCTEVPEVEGRTVQVQNGRTFVDVFITEEMVGHKLGEFSITRTFRGHTNKKEGIRSGR